MTNKDSNNNTSEIASISLKPARLGGTVKVSGAKNSVLRLMAATLLTSETVAIHNYPATLLDAIVHKDMLNVLGKNCVVENDILFVKEEAGLVDKLAWDGRSIRNTLLILGGLVARTGFGFRSMNQSRWPRQLLGKLWPRRGWHLSRLHVRSFQMASC